MWWYWTWHCQSLYGTWLLQASPCYLTTRVKGKCTFLFLSAINLLDSIEDQYVMLLFFNFYYRLAWDFSVVQLSSKVLKSSRMVRSTAFTKKENCFLCVTNVPSFVGYLSGWSGPEPAAVWRCEPAGDEARVFIPECEDTHSRAAWGTISHPTSAAHVSQKEHPGWIWWADAKFNHWNIRMISRLV